MLCYIGIVHSLGFWALCCNRAFWPVIGVLGGVPDILPSACTLEVETFPLFARIHCVILGRVG